METTSMTHKRRSPQEWQHLIQTQQTSGLSIADFCRQHSLNPSTFYLQRKKLTELTLTPASDNWLP
jgi:transposase-like protein